MIHGENGDSVNYENLKNCEESDAAEEATSRKCEGQLSSVKANSCSSCKAVNRTTEMAQEDNTPCWDSLPSVILQKIFSYLHHENRIGASQVCKNWRYALFHPSFWKKITFTLKDEDSISWARYLIECFGLSVHEVTIRCEMSSRCVKETALLLKKLSCNMQLRKLFLESSSNIFECPVWRMDNEDDSQANSTSLLKSIMKIIETSNCLEALSLGCIEELTGSASIILEPLRLHHAKHLKHLSLASVKDDPDHYDSLEIDNSIFNSFISLTILTVDYDFVSDALLKALDNGCMERLVIHVHGWNDKHPLTTNRAWQIFTKTNPKCELRLSLIHSYVGVEVLDTDILRPAMPLTHLKVLFCEDVNIYALQRLSNWYQYTLKSLIWIDARDPMKEMTLISDPEDPDSPDPLMLAAWKCTKLVEIIIIGHKYHQESLLAIGRLRGGTLESFVFPRSDIEFDYESWHKAETIMLEIEQIMGRRWEPINDRDLPVVIRDPFRGDSREAIIPVVLDDQK